MAKRILLPVIIIMVWLGSFLLNGCDTSSYDMPKYTEFVMKIDSITMPSTINLGQRLKIKFYGYIGPNGCYSFSRFDAKAEKKNISVTVYGKKTEEQVCNQAVSYLNGGVLEVNLMDTGTYVVHVQQPFPPDIYDTVKVGRPF